MESEFHLRRPCGVIRYFREVYFSCAFVILVFCIFGHAPVLGGPVFYNPAYMQGPVSAARNIRHLSCISRRTGEEGVCMFAIDCLKANGSHLGTCIDRFYFGSCCQVPDQNSLPQILNNNIDDNSAVSDISNEFTTKNSVRTASTLKSDVESKVTPSSLDASSSSVGSISTKAPMLDRISTTSNISVSTQYPIKLSTFQTVIDISDKPTTQRTTTKRFTPPKVTNKPIRYNVTKKPGRPSYKPRPTYRPIITNKPVTYTVTTTVRTTPKPTTTSTQTPVKSTSEIFFDELTLNVTKRPIPPYKPPPKRTTTTIKPSTYPKVKITPFTKRPTRPQHTTDTPVTYINMTAQEFVPKPVAVATTTTSTTTPSTTTTTTTTESPTTFGEKFSTITHVETEKATVDAVTDKLNDDISTPGLVTWSYTVDEVTKSPSSTESEPIKSPPVEFSTEYGVVKDTSTPTTVETTTTYVPITTISDNFETVSSYVPQKVETIGLSTSTETFKPSQSEPSTTEAIESTVEETEDTAAHTTGSIQQATVTELNQDWSPITPPDGWVLVSTISPTTDVQHATIFDSTAAVETTIVETEPTVTADATTFKQTTPSSERVTTFSSIEKTTQATFDEKITTLTYDEPTLATTALPTLIDEMTSISSTASEIPSVSSTASVTSTFAHTSSEMTTPSSPVTTVSSSTTKSPVILDTTVKPKPEFVVNVTLTAATSTSTEKIVPAPSSVTGILIPVTVNISEIFNVTEPSVQQSIDETSPSSVIKSNTTQVNATKSPEVTEKPLNMSDYKEVCGRRIWPEARIVGGSKSGFGRWPWQISLRQWKTNTYLHKCGAALLNENWAITAAHCVDNVPPSELLVRLGEHDLAHEAEPYGFQERRVQIVASHPHFEPATFEYDLALLRFYEPVMFQPNILPVCVPDDDDDYVGQTAYVTGWGRLFDEGPLPSILQEVSVPIINNTACEGMYRAAGFNEHIPNIFICAGWKKGGADSCEGDSGGPMVIPRKKDSRFVLGGVISWGIGCAEPNQPGVYTRISEFRDWINQILQF